MYIIVCILEIQNQHRRKTMKKIIIPMAILFAFAFLFQFGCGGETELRWDNQGGAHAWDIIWADNVGNEPEVSWNDNVTDGSKSSFKTVKALVGGGEVNLGGTTGSINLGGDKEFTTLAEGESQELSITGLVKK